MNAPSVNLDPISNLASIPSTIPYRTRASVAAAATSMATFVTASTTISSSASPPVHIAADPDQPSYSKKRAARKRAARIELPPPIETVLDGPRHLEYDYAKALDELRAAVIAASYKLGYQPPRRCRQAAALAAERRRSAASKPSIQAIKAARFPDVDRARKQVDTAYAVLSEAVARGETWWNTPLPPRTGERDEPNGGAS